LRNEKIFSKKLAEIKIVITFAARFEREVGFEKKV
jgi:hypothetical protein